MPRYASDAVGFALFIVAVHLFSLVLARLGGRRRASAGTPRRLTKERARAALTWQVPLATILYLLQRGAGWTSESVGFRSAVPLLVAVFVGAEAVVIVAATYELALRGLGVLDTVRKATFRANLRVWPRTGPAKLSAGVAFFVLNPVTEELLMRGILIHQWSLLIGSPTVPLVVGFIANALLHSYQGWRVQAWHGLFFSLIVAILYSPIGMAGAIGAHIAGDVVPIVTLRRQARQARRSAA